MPRPRKWRKVCCMPSVNRFGPLGGCMNDAEPIQMTVDEYETIRLLDMEGMNQEACAAHMNVARTTVQGIYLEARRKVAQALVEGRVLLIDGGDYHLCDGTGQGCHKGGCHKERQNSCGWSAEAAEEKLG